MPEDLFKAATDGDEASAPPLTNADRLRAHLKPEGLATALLDAWIAGEPTGAQSRMLAALTAFHQPKQASDGSAQTSED